MMNKELFGVFGSRSEFCRFRSPVEFDRIIEGETITVGVRDIGLGIPGRTTTYEDETGVCVLWGEVSILDDPASQPAAWLLENYAEYGDDALSALNGSYLALLDDGETSFVATDQVRTWECYYTDEAGTRVFGTDPTAVATVISEPEAAIDAMLEFFHLGVVTGDRTVLEQLKRTPFDSCLAEDSTRSLPRFVYRPREFDYVAELADRLQRAMARRATNPGRKGLLLSGGYDSRVIAAGVDNLDQCYTIGVRDGAEVSTAKKVAAQYGVAHQTLQVDGRYLNTNPELIKYGHGIHESLHIHHGGYTPQMNVDTIYHGLLFDTFFRGHFLPRDGVTLFGHTYPRNRLDPDPDVARTILDTFGFLSASQEIFPACDRIPDSSVEFTRRVVESQLDTLTDRYDSLYNAIALFGIQNQPSMPFRTHLADQYLESFVAVDAELLDWHLTTPPEYRNTRTFLKAIRRIDDDILRSRPPDRPYDSIQLNELEKFVRRNVPFLSSFGKPWPDRRTLYEHNNLDEKLFPDCPEIHHLPPRLKLRINDIREWLKLTDGDLSVAPVDILCPPYGNLRKIAH